VERQEAEACLLALQVTARSTLGALALHTGGVVIDHGWLRLLGGGHGRLPSLATANGVTDGQQPPVLLIGFDVLGGRFAIDGGAATGNPVDVFWLVRAVFFAMTTPKFTRDRPTNTEEEPELIRQISNTYPEDVSRKVYAVLTGQNAGNA
jgi:hypothetical protein